MADPTQAAVMKWRKQNKAGWKLAAKHFGITVAKLHTICEHTPRARAHTHTCASCEVLKLEVASLKRGTTAEERVRGSRVDFLRTQLAESLVDLDNLRDQERTGTAISVQTRTIAELREQLDDEIMRLLEAEGDPLEDMHAEELLADIAEVIHGLPDSMAEPIAEMMARRFGKEVALLLD